MMAPAMPRFRHKALAALLAAVTGALTEDWRAANPPKETGADLLARILEARRTADGWVIEL